MDCTLQSMDCTLQSMDCTGSSLVPPAGISKFEIYFYIGDTIHVATCMNQLKVPVCEELEMFKAMFASVISIDTYNSI